MLKSTRFFFSSYCILLIVGLIISGIRPFDYFTWFLEVVPAVVGFLILVATRKSFPLTNLLYFLILLHSYVLFLGGHYTYAEVPLFNTIKDFFNHDRNNYDKIGHFMQGFVPAIIARELLIRKKVISKKSWLSFIIVSICLAISAVYEFIEAIVAILTGENAEAFLGTQGFVWDTQSDMFLAMVGAILALIFLSNLHDREMKIIEESS